MTKSPKDAFLGTYPRR